MKVCTFPVDKRNLLCSANLTVDTYKLNERAGVCNSVSQLLNCSFRGTCRESFGYIIPSATLTLHVS